MPGYQKRTQGLFNPSSTKPFRLSRSKIDLFVNCPRCFYLDRRLGVGRPSIPAFTLNSAVDHLFKKEFDIHRAKGEPHPLMKQYGIDAVPFEHKKMQDWRHNFRGVERLHEPTNFLVFGAVDDLWINSSGEIHVVDYKATSKKDKPNLDGYWQQAYKRQMEVYQWLLRGNDLKVSDTGYFVYANGKRDMKAFDARLEFDVDVLEYKGSDAWIEKTLIAARELLDGDSIPDAGTDCEHCPYREVAQREIHKVAGVKFTRKKT